MINEIYYGNSTQDWMISAAIIVGAVILCQLIIFINKRFISKFTRKTNVRFDEILSRTLQSPLVFGIMLVAIWAAFSRLNLPEKADKYIGEAYKVLTVINITWFLNALFRSLIVEYLTPKPENANIRYRSYMDHHKITILGKTVTIIVWILGIIMAMSNIGINIGALLGTLGIGGVAFALASQDTIKNIFGGFTIFSDGTFRIGDRIKVANYDGVVEDIGVRSTRLRTFEKRLVIIPNYKIVEGAVENVSDENMFRVKVKLGLMYSTTAVQMRKALEILKGIASENEHVDKNSITAVFSNFEDAALIINFIYFLKKDSDVMQVPSEINLKILEHFNAENLQLAFPSQTIVINKDGEQ